MISLALTALATVSAMRYEASRGKVVFASSLEQSIKEKEGQISSAQNEKKALQNQLSDLEKMKKELEKTKNDLTNYVTQLDANLISIQEKIDELKELITEKEEEIAVQEQELEHARQVEADQYAAMKSRIRFMYESGDAMLMDILFAGEGIGNMVNKADYIEALSAYDRSMLDHYVEVTKYVQACKESLESQKDVLEEAKSSVQEEEAALETLIGEKEQEIDAYQSDINNKAQAIAEYEAQIREQNEIIAALEAAVAEERRKLQEMNGSIRRYDGGMFAWPAPSYTRISSEFGNRIHPTLGTQSFHNGVDMAAPGGSPILAAYDGEVVAAAYSASMGNYIMINHGDSLYTVYMHASALYVSKGQTVSKGQKIAAVGSTGRSTGNHLHFSVRKNGSYVNPWSYLGS